MTAAYDDVLDTPAATEAAGALIGRAWTRAGEPGCLIVLEGDLGAGKTTLMRGLLRALGEPGPIRSPTYTLLETYQPRPGRFVHHLDCYRIDGWDALEDIGFRDLLQPATLVAVEWPAKVPGLAARADLALRLEPVAERRRLHVLARTALGRALLPGRGHRREVKP